MNKNISNTEDVLDVRDIIERFEELESSEDRDEYDEQEFKSLQSLLDELCGNGGDEQWKGDWYPLILIREDYFEEYCEELVSDIGDLPREIPSYIEIDWKATAENIKVDYFSVDFDGVTYWTR